MAGRRCGPISDRHGFVARRWPARLLLGALLALTGPLADARAATTVGRVTVSGGREMRPAEVLERLGLREGDACDTLAFAAGADRLAADLAAAGYLDARVRVGWSALPAPATPAEAPGPGGAGALRLAVEVEVSPGAPWRVRGVTQIGADSTVAARCRPLRLRSGRVWSRAELEKDLETWLDAYDAAGYAYARLRPVELAADSGLIDITLRHDPGPVVRLTAIELEGARVTQPRTVERVMGFRANAPFNRERLALGLQRLRQAGLFSEIAEPELITGADPAEGRLRLRVREAPPGSLSGILGYSGQDRRLAGHIDFRLRNMGGSGRQLEARWSGQTRGSTLYQFGFREPRLLDRPVDGTFRMEHLLFDTLYVRTRFEVGLGWRPLGPLRLDAALGADRAVVTAGVNRTYRSTRWHGTATWDARDALFRPARGALVMLDGEVGQSLSGTYGDQADGDPAPIFRGQARGELYTPAWRGAIVALTAQARTLRTRAHPVPQYELFPLGGAITLRGYREEQFYTPAYLLTQFEYRFAASALGSGVYLFTDAAWFAMATRPVSTAPPLDQFKLGYGAGLRVGSRAGRVGVDYGLAAGEGPLDGRIHLRIEAEF